MEVKELAPELDDAMSDADEGDDGDEGADKGDGDKEEH